MSRNLLAEFSAYIGADIDTIDQQRVDRLRMEAEALIRAAKPSLVGASVDWPDNAFIVLLRVMARGMNTAQIPSGVDRVSENAGDFSYSYSFNENALGGGLWLSKQDKLILGVAGGGSYAVNLGVNARVQSGYDDGWRSW